MDKTNSPARIYAVKCTVGYEIRLTATGEYTTANGPAERNEAIAVAKRARKAVRS